MKISKDSPSSPGDALAHAALRDAERETPAFSEALHARVMRAVQSGGAARGTERWADRPSPFWRLTPAAAAAAVALAIGVAWYARHATPPRQEQALQVSDRPDQSGRAGTVGTQPTPLPTTPPTAAVPVPSIQLAVEQVSEGEAALEADLGPGQWAGLGHDARVAMQYVLGPLPVKSPKAVDDWGR